MRARNGQRMPGQHIGRSNPLQLSASLSINQIIASCAACSSLLHPAWKNFHVYWMKICSLIADFLRADLPPHRSIGLLEMLSKKRFSREKLCCPPDWTAKWTKWTISHVKSGRKELQIWKPNLETSTDAIQISMKSSSGLKDVLRRF